MLENYTTYLAVALILALLLVVAAGSVFKFKPKPLKYEYYQEKWEEIQALFGEDKTTWPLAVINADKLLDNALKTRRFRGKTMGERMVAAQKRITNNDAVWFGHKLRNRLVHEADSTKLRSADVKQALEGFRKALKDLGALPK